MAEHFDRDESPDEPQEISEADRIELEAARERVAFLRAQLQPLRDPDYEPPRRRSGPTAVEWSIMLTLIIIFCLAAISLLGPKARREPEQPVWHYVTTTMHTNIVQLVVSKAADRSIVDEYVLVTEDLQKRVDLVTYWTMEATIICDLKPDDCTWAKVDNYQDQRGIYKAVLEIHLRSHDQIKINRGR